MRNQKFFSFLLIFILGVVLISCANPVEITIDFYDGDTLLESHTSNGSSLVTMPDEPTKEGYTFVGWFFDDEIFENQFLESSLVDQPVKENFNLYAKWNIHSYTLQFLNDDDSVILSTSYPYEANLSEITVPTPVKVGHTFSGWDQVLPQVMPASNLTLKALFTINQYTLSFDTNDGSLIDPIVLNYQATIIEPSNPTKEGFNFVGWFSDELLSITYTFTSMPSNDLTLYAKWEPGLPVITGAIDFTLIKGLTAEIDYTQGVTAYDLQDGDLTAEITIDSSEVNEAVSGVYEVTYTVIDSDQNTVSVSIFLTLIIDTEAPVISGLRDLFYIIGDDEPIYTLGLTVSDNISLLDATDIIVDSSFVNLAVEGTYPVYFSVTDEVGNVGEAETIITVSEYLIDSDATYYASTKGSNNLNPHSESTITNAELYQFVTDSLYSTDYDFDAARQILIEEGHTNLPAKIGFKEWYAFGKTAAELPYNRFPQMADGLPIQMDLNGLVWQITLRNDLEFEDGTKINAATFDYSWRQLLDPKLLNNNASNLYSTTRLPLVNAEDYYKQLTPDTDEFGFIVYKVDGIKYERGNSYFGVTADGYDIYTVEAKYSNLIGPGGIKAYVEFWGSSLSSYGLNGWVLETQADEYFRIGTDDKLYAPTAGWTLDGVAVPHVLPVGVSYKFAGAGFAGAYPAYADSEGNLAIVDPVTGIPVGGVQIFPVETSVTWEEVGFKIIGDPATSLTFEITLSSGRTAWDVMSKLTSAITGVIHPDAYEAGMNLERTFTTYGTIDNPLVSYGPYQMTTWEEDHYYLYTLNLNHYDSSDYRITQLRYDIITNPPYAVDLFVDGNLDVVETYGIYYNQFSQHVNLKLSPTTTFFRFAFNIQGGVTSDINPILIYPEFRKAFYFAIDRETYTSQVRAPNYPTFGFLGPAYLSTDFNMISYRSSQPGQDVLADFSPETYGYNPTEAKRLFDIAYAKAVAAGDIRQGAVVSVELKYSGAETSNNPYMWFKNNIEAIFNAGELTPKFELRLVGVYSPVLTQQIIDGEFEIIYGGWQGLAFDAPSMLGQVYNSHYTYMLERGFNTKDAIVIVSLPHSRVALENWIAEYLLLETPTEDQTTQYDRWVAMLALFDGDVLTTTFHELYIYAYEVLYNALDYNYQGKADDFDAITAALEGVLLDQMIAIPLFTTVGATVYSNRVVFEADEFHSQMVFGGFKYMYIKKT